MAKSNNSIVVTGASGFIGRHVLPLLVARGWQVHAISSRSCPSVASGVHWHIADLLHEGAARRMLNAIRPSHLLHLAWFAEPGKYWHSDKNYSWLNSSLELARAFADAGGERLVAAGSCAEYDWRFGFCLEDETPLRPTTAYGAAKKTLGQLLDIIGQDHGIEVAWGRVFFLYGPNEHPARLVPAVINALLRGETVKCSEGKQLRDYLYVEDVATAFITLLESHTGGAHNIASSDPVSVRDIIGRIAMHLSKPQLPEYGALPLADGEPPVLAGSHERLRALGWQPQTELDEGICHSINWWRQRRGVMA